MTCLFVCHTLEWESIGRALKKYLNYCHGIQNFHICKVEYTCNGAIYKDIKNNKNIGINKIDIDLLIIPLFENRDNKIKPEGLRLVKSLRGTNGYSFNTLFLVLSESEIPPYFNPEKKASTYATDIVKNPEFGDENKAIFLGELLYKKDQKNNRKNVTHTYENIISLFMPEALGSFIKKIEFLLKDRRINQSRKLYYDTFVNFYDPLRVKPYSQDIMARIEDIVDNDFLNKLKRQGADEIKEGHSVHPLLALSNYIYNSLHNININQSGHTVELELFRAPIPFPLQELVDARNELKDILTESGRNRKKVKLLLIDNREDKFRKKDSEKESQTLFDAFSTFGLRDIFELKMIGGEGLNFDFKGENETFKYKLFKENAELIYENIKSSHFVLLDFFLNEENTYLAFDFIKDIAKIKEKEGDHSTTWYFITSAVYDSVVKYSQSGLLAEYYESAVVNAGDDPTNKKRQIIFVYKLLTFINARLKSFLAYKEVIEKRLINRDLGWNCMQYPHGCGKNECLEEMLRKTKKYVTELEEVHSIFYKEDSKQKIEEVMYGLENVIKNFMWLPEADWPMIQRQIEHINSRLEHIDDFKNRRFSCNYIREQIKKRSDIY